MAEFQNKEAPAVNRKDEIRNLLSLTPEQMIMKAKGRLTILDTLEQLHNNFAEEVFSEIVANNDAGNPTRLILPVGPTGQYPVLANMLNDKKVNLKNCFLFFMDEYCDDNGHVFPANHPLSFKGIMEKIFFSHLSRDCGLKKEQIVFPDHLNIRHLNDMIENVGGIDTCYAGVGITGHLAFNEPEPGVSNSGPRLVYLNLATITINAIRAHVGGNLTNFPGKAVTLGMKQILGAKRIIIYCRNDVSGLDWANTVLRLALFGRPGDDYPITYVRNKNYSIITTKETAARPDFIL